MKAFKNIIASFVVLFGSACTETDYSIVVGQTETEVIVEHVEVEPDVEIWVESFTQLKDFDDMDILWVIDNSCSMETRHHQLTRGVEAMMNNLPLGVNWRLKMITAGDDPRYSQSTLFPLTRGDDIADAINMLDLLPIDPGEAGFGAVQNYINTDAYARTWMRQDAALLTVFVSDEPEQSGIPVSDFVWWYTGLRDNVFASAIVNVPDDETVCPYRTSTHNIGQQYLDAVDSLGGTYVDICNLDWATAVQDATQEIKPIEDYQLLHKPYEDTIVVFVNGSKFDEWYYVQSENRIYFDVMPLAGDLVEMAYAVKEYSSIESNQAGIDMNTTPTTNLSP